MSNSTTKGTKAHKGNPVTKAFVTLLVLSGLWFFLIPDETDPPPAAVGIVEWRGRKLIVRTAGK
jgi:hypothetical protein